MEPKTKKILIISAIVIVCAYILWKTFKSDDDDEYSSCSACSAISPVMLWREGLDDTKPTGVVSPGSVNPSIPTSGTTTQPTTQPTARAPIKKFKNNSIVYSYSSDCKKPECRQFEKTWNDFQKAIKEVKFERVNCNGKASKDSKSKCVELGLMSGDGKSSTLDSTGAIADISIVKDGKKIPYPDVITGKNDLPGLIDFFKSQYFN